jgi:hypothetical protein
MNKWMDFCHTEESTVACEFFSLFSLFLYSVLDSASVLEINNYLLTEPLQRGTLMPFYFFGKNLNKIRTVTIAES